MKEGTIVKTKTRKGTFLGKIDALGNEAYLGIPYCLPAVGERRWLPAQEEPDQETEREAFAFSPLAPRRMLASMRACHRMRTACI